MYEREFLPFALPDIGEDEIAEVVDTLRSGWITTGPRTKAFESAFSEWLGKDVHSVAINSATAGLHLALEAIGVRRDDEVITTTHTFTATAEVIRYLGAHPVFVDIDPATLCIDADRIESAITSRTKALIPVHFGGLSANMKAIHAIASRHGLRVVEDAAHALGATYDGELIGTLSSAATVFSFYANKNITTGEGGMLVTEDAELASRARVMRTHGIDRDAFGRFHSAKPSWYYEVIAPGYKYNVTDIAAAIGIHQLRKANDFRSRRTEIAEHYFDLLSDLPLMLPPRARSGDLHAWHLFVVQLDVNAGLDRDKFIERMVERGIGVSVHYIPLHAQPYWRDAYGLDAQSFPVSQRTFERSVSLPIYSLMTKRDVQRVVDAVKNVLT